MTRFLTVDSPDLPNSILLWEERDAGPPRIAGRFSRLEDVPGSEDLEVWCFEQPLTTAKNSAINEGHYPVVDVDGAPLWKGARISFRVPTFYVNSAGGTGVFTKTDQYGGTYFVADSEMPIHTGRNGTISGYRREQYAPVSDWPGAKHELVGYRVLTSKLGDPFEHGQTTMFFRLDDDPRSICKLERSPVATLTPGGR